MQAISDHPKSNQADLARHLGWLNHKGEVLKSRVSRIVKELKKQKLVEEGRAGITLTSKGQKAIKEKSP